MECLLVTVGCSGESVSHTGSSDWTNTFLFFWEDYLIRWKADAV